MKQIMKRLLGIMLVIAMVIGMVPVSAVSVEAATTSKVYFKAPSDWNKAGAYMWNGSSNNTNPEEMDLVNSTENVYSIGCDNYVNIIFTNAVGTWGSSKTGDLVIPTESLDENTYHMYDGTKNLWTVCDANGEELTKRIYFDTTACPKGAWGNTYIYMGTSENSFLEEQQMNGVSGKSGVFYYDVPISYSYVKFRPNSGQDDGATTALQILSDYNMFVGIEFSSETKGKWSTYTESETPDPTPSSEYTVYFNTSGNLAASWGTGTVYVHGYSSDGTTSGDPVAMSYVAPNIYKCSFNKAYEYVIFLNKNNWDVSNNDYSFRTVDNNKIPWSTYTNPIFRLDGGYENGTGKKTGTWTNYDDAGSTSTSSTKFYVNADFVDYYNDARIDDGETSQSDILNTNNEGNLLGDRNKLAGKNVAFSYLNGKISSVYGNSADTIPLYFGSLLFVNNRIGRTDAKTANYNSLLRWNTTANVALTTANQSNNNVDTAQHNTDACVQKLVKNELGPRGELYGIDGTELPFFSKTTANSWTISVDGNNRQLMQYYEGYEFPFVESVIEGSNIKKYSYDSETDYSVYLSSDLSEKKLKTSASHIANSTKEDTDGDGEGDREVNGYYPFNDPTQSISSSRAEVNYGFGTKFTIPFTINKNGTISGNPYIEDDADSEDDVDSEDDADSSDDAITFEFTGDDDVWVFLDGKLVLDMGGAHGKAKGTINFATKSVTVEDACEATTDGSQMNNLTSNVANSYEAGSNGGLINYYWANDSVERSKVSTSSVTKSFADLHGELFASSFDDESKSHTLVMFYMERGMFDSNMKVEFTINPIPSGLSLSKTLDTADVNSGLTEAVKEAESDNFNFEILTKDLTKNETDYSAVSDLEYSLNDYNNSDKSGYTATNSIVTGVGAKSFAHSFINATANADAFVAGTGFKITELTEPDDVDTVFEYDYTKTSWAVYDKKNSYKVIDAYTADDESEDRLIAEFAMGDSTSSSFDSYDYNVNFKNKPYVGVLSLKKTWDTSQTASTEKYSFSVLIDLDGEGTEYDYTAYKLDGDIADTDAEGKIELIPGQTVTFKGIPAGASYKIVENIPEDADYSSNQTSNTVTGSITKDDTETSPEVVEFKNSYNSKSINKVIYVEAKENTEENSNNATIYEPKTDSGDSITVTEFVTDSTLLPKDTTATKNTDASGNVTSVTYKITDASSETIAEITVSISDGKVVVKTDDANQQFDIPYIGETDGIDVTGTITVFSYRATNKVYVFDYGLESDIAVTNDNNDGLFQDGVFYNSMAEATSEKDTKYNTTATLNSISEPKIEVNTTDEASGETKSEVKDIDTESGDSAQTDIVSVKYATTGEGENAVTTTSEISPSDIAISTEGKATNTAEKVVGVMFKPLAFMDRKEIYDYQVNIARTGVDFDEANPETGTVVNGTIKVMPANVVYYEDNFGREITITDKDGTKIVNSTPIALTQSNDQEELYGYDDSYNSQTGDSAGGSTGLEVGAKATFTFKGTGFDLIARTSSTTGSIVFKVKDIPNNDVKYYGAVDTYYKNGELYQLPVLSIKNMDYSTYEVTILVVDNEIDGADTFYLDGVRIYDPAGDSLDEYYINNEAEAEIKDIRQMILGNCEITESGIVDPDTGASITSAEVGGSTASILYYSEPYADEEGETFPPELYYYGYTNQEDMKSNEPNYSNSLAEYLQRGPANEVYLGSDSGVAFVVKAEKAENLTFQVEAKAVDLSTASLSETLKLSMLDDTQNKKTIANVATNTAMYYEIPVTEGINLGDDYYLVVLIGEDTGSQCISLTNLKVDGYAVSSPTDSSNVALVEEIIYEPIFGEVEYSVDVEFVKYENTVLRGREVKAIVSVPEGSKIDGFQVYGNDNALTTKMEIIAETNDTKDDEKTQYRVIFMMAKSKGTYTLKFVPYKLDADGENRIESAAYLSKSVTIRK